ncbi:MAG: hypothetical protein GC178_15945 [Flavobacteriales bacterium]|nr:hypothetical protein [Flavobacteriales bacterium]
MRPDEIDYVAFALLLLRWFAIIFVIYIIFIFLLRFSNYYKIKKCPNCSGELKRAQRTAGDRLLKTLTFGILPVKRYRCYTCYWEGQAFEIKDRKRSSAFKDETEEDL